MVRALPATATPAKSIKVGLVTDIGGLNDRSFNQLANEGLEQAKSELGVDGRVLTSKSNADYVPNLSTLAQQKYDLVIGVGFLMADAMDTVADEVPRHEVRDHRLLAVGPEGQADQRRAACCSRSKEAGYLVGLPRRPRTSRTRAATR